MCGIAGFLNHDGLAPDSAVALLRTMTSSIAHRGPDDSGVWFDAQAGIALGHRRLSILDLSPAGHQPMCSAAGRYVLIFNGEIYNHLDIRSELGERSWRGHSDTETLLAAIEVWGVEHALKRTVGMFALALWDRHERVLTLARDRLGEKPLYYGWQGHGQKTVLLFASELKAIRAHPAFEGAIDRDALALQLRYSYVPAPHSIYQGIRKLLPGTLIQFGAGNKACNTQVARPYWSLAEAISGGRSHPLNADAPQAIAELDSLLRDAVRQQMVSDVPLGAFLSGGIDSSTIVALMQQQSSRPIKTFTIGFSEEGYDEAKHAKAVARHLGTDHTELYVSPSQAQEVIPRLPTMYDEPFSDSSQIPTFLVSELARRQVTVSLSGDAGDELFGGYTRYLGTSRWWNRIRPIPKELRRLSARALMMPTIPAWHRVGTCLAWLSGNEARWLNLPNLVPKLASVLRSNDIASLYGHFTSHWMDSSEVVLGSSLTATAPTCGLGNVPSDAVEQMMAMDTLTYLPDDILVKVDRAAMAVSLETRVPFLDHRVVEFAWRLALSLKIRNGQGKWILRQVLEKYVPRSLTDRPKMGFGVPIDSWLRGPLRVWAEELLAEDRLRQEGFLNPGPIRTRWAEHLSGRFNWQYLLWDVLMFQSWLEHERGSIADIPRLKVNL